MSWRLSIDHTTKYTYHEMLKSQHNELRMTPRDSPRQFTIEHTLAIEPATHIYRYKDYFGTRVASFAIEEPHQQLEVRGHSVVETASGAPHPSKAPISWKDIGGDTVTDKFYEYLVLTSFADHSDDYIELVNDIKSYETPGLGVTYFLNWIRDNLTYTPGATDVYTPASEVFRDRQGVCQDYVHLTLAIMREAGIPARYASGYLYPDEGEIGESVVGESHAWCDVWLGDWHGIDPTNDTAVAERHVLVGWGRDYSDVAPVKGVINGNPASNMHVEVSLRRTA